MGKIFKLKEWFTLEETAKRLTSSLGEDVSIVDCLSLALDKRLVISAMLRKSIYAVNAEIKTTTLRKERGDFIIHSDDNGATVELLLTKKYFTNAELDCEYEEVVRHGPVFRLRHGIYDLPMIGSEVFDVMYLFDEEQGRTPRDFTSLEGAFLLLAGGLVNILESFNRLTVKYDGENVSDFDPVKNEFVDFNNHSRYFYPADGLGNVEFVFRRIHIEKFEQSVLNDDNDKFTLNDSLLIIGTLISVLKKAEPASKRWTQEALTREILDTLPITTISKRAIDDYFSEANKRFKSNK